MHDLKRVTALGEATPRVDTIGTITIAENDGVALASVAARLGHEAACKAGLADLLGATPEVGKAILRDPEAGFWMGPDQWMIGAPRSSHDDLADQLALRLKEAASVTEQSGAWVVFDITGKKMADLCEILCNIPIRRMTAGDVQRTMIHQMSCFVIRRIDDDHIRILGPRASARSLHHALVTAARSVG